MNHILNKHFGGWRPSLPDARDYKLRAPSAPVILPVSIDLRSEMPPVYDQGTLGSCTANAAAAMYQHDMIVRKGLSVFRPSRLFIYYNERTIDGDVSNDAGSSLRTAAKAIATYGVCNESSWPYDVEKFRIKPPDQDYTSAAHHKAMIYKSLDNTDMKLLKACLAQHIPIMFGFSVYTSFESQAVADTGIVPMPVVAGLNREQLLGGHANVIVGYDDAKISFLCRNSWGTDWGIKGYYWIPYAYLTDSDLASDFWQISSITG